MINDFWAIDFAPLLCAILSAVSCTIAGTLLLARNQSMTVDAISHMVLPGMVIAFFISGSISFIGVFWGALVASVLGIWLVEILSKNHDRGAVLGMVFSFWFALGIFLLEAFVDSRVHFDVTHILFGSLESNYWLDLGYTREVGIIEVLANMPNEIAILIQMVVLISALVAIFYKEVVMVSFDYNYARTVIKKAPIIYYGIPIIITMAIVSSFRIIGLIMILGMFIIPPLFASLFSINLITRIFIGIAFAIFICVVGYGFAVYVPIFAGSPEFSLNVGGTIISFGTALLFIIVGIKELLRFLNRFYDIKEKLRDI